MLQKDMCFEIIVMQSDIILGKVRNFWGLADELFLIISESNLLLNSTF